MSDTIETLGQLLDPAGNGLSRGDTERLDGSPAMVAVRGALGAVPGAALADLSHGVADVLKTVLDIQLGDVLAGVWKTGRKLVKYRDPTAYPPDHVVEVALGEHVAKTTLHPRVAIFVNDIPVPGAEIAFTVALALTIESAVLRVRAARIIGATVAKCRGKGTLSCGDIVLLECPTREFALPTISFGAGVALA